MNIIVGGRRSGRTTKLVGWLLEGQEQAGYPQWSRVILCATNTQVRWLYRFLQDEIERRNWTVNCGNCLPHLAIDCLEHHEHVMAQVRKAIWGFEDFQANTRGVRDFEYAIDDAEQMIFSGFVVRNRPSVIVLEGEVWE